MRVAGCLVVIGLLTASCSSGDESSDLRSFRLEGKEYPTSSRPEGPTLPQEWTHLEAVVVEAPVTVTAGDNVDVVVELRNPSVDPLALDPCPVWSAGFGGDDSEMPPITGVLPCDEIEQLAPGERIRMLFTVPSPSFVDFNEGGLYSTFDWYLEHVNFEEFRASIAVPMRERN